MSFLATLPEKVYLILLGVLVAQAVNPLSAPTLAGLVGAVFVLVFLDLWLSWRATRNQVIISVLLTSQRDEQERDPCEPS